MSQPPASAEPAFLEGLRRGDPAAMAEVYDQYAPMLFRVGCRFLGEPADAEDLVHDVFVGLPRAAQSFEGRGTFEGWLTRVAIRTALMRMRRQRAQDTRGWHQRWLRPTAVRAEPIAERLDLEGALQSLSPALRVVFLLREVHGYSHPEIAEMLGIGVGAAKVRLYRSRRQLRALLEGE